MITFNIKRTRKKNVLNISWKLTFMIRNRAFIYDKEFTFLESYDKDTEPHMDYNFQHGVFFSSFDNVIRLSMCLDVSVKSKSLIKVKVF